MELEEIKKYFDIMPIAFTVIELVLDDKRKPVDWIFRYVNQALCELEEVSSEGLLNKRFFGDVFPEKNDKKWLPYYHSAAFYAQTHELHEYSPEIRKYLKITCYPWLKRGYCACVLFDETNLFRARQRLKYLAHYDEMTKFKNRNAYNDFLTEMQKVNNLGIIFVDLNGLKTLNDRLGHEAGDALLHKVTDCIRKTFPHTDTIFRIGGDEFVIILTDTDQAECREQAEHLKLRLRNSTIAHFPSVLASVGWSWSDQGEFLEYLIQQADESMYKEKCRYYDMSAQKKEAADLRQRTEEEG